MTLDPLHKFMEIKKALRMLEGIREAVRINLRNPDGVLDTYMQQIDQINNCEDLNIRCEGLSGTCLRQVDLQARPS